MRRDNGFDVPEYSNPGTRVLLLPTGRALPVRRGEINRDVINTLTAEEADALLFYAYRVRKRLSARAEGYGSVHRAMMWIHYRCKERKEALGQPDAKFRRRHELREAVNA